MLVYMAGRRVVLVGQNIRVFVLWQCTERLVFRKKVPKLTSNNETRVEW